jgi:anaerobic sulfite reductase subunit B
MEPGGQLFVRGPYGRPFPADTFAGTHTVIAAGGTGLAPVKGLIQELLARRGNQDGPVRLDLLLGFRTPADILFRDDIAVWTEQTGVSVTVDRAAEQWDGHVGVITTLIPDLTFLSGTPRRVVVVGPPLMMKYTVAAFLERGIDESDILVSYERRMSCGVGKCGHCKINDTYVCVDGPVFNYADAQWLMD